MSLFTQAICIFVKTLKTFIMNRKKFQNENKEAENFFYNLKVNQGIICKRCGSSQHSYIKTIKMFTCSNCKHRTTLKSDTIMHSSKLSLLTWYRAFELIQISKKGISAKEMQRHLKLKNYRPAFELMHKIRSVMGIIELNRICELREGYVKTKTKMDIKDSEERSKQHKILILNEKADNGNYIVGMISCAEINKYKLTGNAKNGIATSRFLNTKQVNNIKLTYFPDLATWTQIHYSNFEKNITGIYHGISPKYRQNYMDEFCFKANVSMAKQDLFEVLTKAAVKHTWCALQRNYVQTGT
jgi:hypothetical protein